MLVEPEQITPMHFHWTKTEDIINRGGSNLVIQLYNATPDERLAASAVTVRMDGVRCSVPAGGTLTLTSRESIPLTAGNHHKFWGTQARVLVGQVSVVNDDNIDNHFYEPVGRFPVVEEDEPPLYYLTNDYPQYLNRRSN